MSSYRFEFLCACSMHFCIFYLITYHKKYRFLEVLDLQENELERGGDQWLNCFPESFTSLVSFHFMHDKGLVDLVALEQLVGRCPNLKSLRLSRAVPLDTLRNILVQAPQLVDLGIGSFAQDTDSETYHKLCQAVRNCKFVSNLSGFLAVLPVCLNAIIPICSNLMFLNLRYAAGIPSTWLIRLISKCRKLQRLWVQIFNSCLLFILFMFFFCGIKKIYN